MSKEINLDDTVYIISETDLKGFITKANEDFIRISGYSEEELIGRPHNILRHPCMPKETFEEMWSTIKSGNTWSGIIKNQAKNGDYYWVKATVGPFDNDKGKGYISIRRKAKENEILEAKEKYKDC